MGDVRDVKALAAEKWFGYGRWAAPYWFIGMEPGGKDEDANYGSWLDLGGGELIDCKQHHLHPMNTGSDGKKWFLGDRPPTQTTWRRLIQVRFAFKGQEKQAANLDVVAKFQSESFGSVCGDTALIELSALHARSLQDKVDRAAHLPERLLRIAKRLDEHPQIEFALFYGRVNREHYEYLAGGAFDPDGFRWRRGTLCVLAPGPTARNPPACMKPEYWIELGTRMRGRIESRDIQR